MGTANTVCADWKFFQDDAGHNQIENAHTNLSDPDSWLDTTIGWRYLLDNTGDKTETDGYKIQYDVDSAGAWADITVGSSYVRAVAGAQHNDGDGTSPELGSGTFDEGYWDEDGAVAEYGLTNGQESENEHYIQFLEADCAGHTIELKVIFDGGADVDGYTYANPSLTFAAGLQTINLSTLAGIGATIDLAVVPGLATVGLDTLAGIGAAVSLTVSSSFGIIWDYDFDAGLGDWTSETDPNGDLNWSNDATAQAVASTDGAVKIDIDDADNMFLEDDLPSANTSGIWRARFYFDPNTITWGNNTDCELLVLQGTAPNWGEVLIVKFGKDGAGNYELHSLAQLDGAGYDSSGTQIISDAPHWVECEVIKSSGGDDGRHRLWIDTLDATVYDSGATLDNDTMAVNVQYCMFGTFGGVPYSDPGGSVYLDELIVNDDGSAIGALAAGGPTVSLDTLAGIGAGVGLTVVPGLATIALNTLVGEGVAVGLSVVPGLATVALSTLIGEGRAISLAVVPGDVTIGLNTLAGIGVVVGLTVAPGDVTIGLNTLAGIGAVIGLTVDVGGAITVVLNTLGGIGAAPSLAVVPGDVAIGLNTLIGQGAAVGLTVAPGLATIGLNTLAGVGATPSLAVVPGLATVGLNTLAGQGAAVGLSVVPGTATIGLNTLAGQGAAVALTVAPGTVTIGLDTLAAIAVPIGLTVSPGGGITVILATLAAVMLPVALAKVWRWHPEDIPIHDVAAGANTATPETSRVHYVKTDVRTWTKP